MRECFRFLSDFTDAAFTGLRGKIGLISLGTALSFLALWSEAEVRWYRHEVVEPPLRARYCSIILFFTSLAWYIVLTNRKNQAEPGSAG